PPEGTNSQIESQAISHPAYHVSSRSRFTYISIFGTISNISLIGICALDANKLKDAPNGKPLYAAFVFSAATQCVLDSALFTVATRSCIPRDILRHRPTPEPRLDDDLVCRRRCRAKSK